MHSISEHITGQLSLFLKSNVDPAMSESDKDDEVNFYLTIFGWMQIFCLLVAPAIGQVLDRNLANAIDDPQLGDKPVEDGTIFRRVQSLQNTRNAYLITQVSFTSNCFRLICKNRKSHLMRNT